MIHKFTIVRLFLENKMGAAQKITDKKLYTKDCKKWQPNFPKGILNVVTYNGFFVSGPILTNEVSFERASKTELN